MEEVHDPVFKDVIAQLSDLDIVRANQRDHPNYWTSTPSTLRTTANVHSVAYGTGHSIYQSSIIPAILQAHSEVILVTCFWAKSSTLNDLSNALRRLSAKGLGLGAGTTIRVRICFSSSSLWQKLLHTTSTIGQTYAPGRWQSSFGLPSPEELPGLDLQVKSIFILPFSVMHPKFVIVDRKQVLLPSCNVSWEDWFEGCMELNGPITDYFVRFWKSFWASDEDRTYTPNAAANTVGACELDGSLAQGLLASQPTQLHNIQTVFLPSPHHQNPRFTFPWQYYAPPPPTPLNMCLLALFAKAERSIFIQTPNLTSPPVLAALLVALKRGIQVHIRTSERLMVLEQLVTAGTTTKRCMNRLIEQHKRLSQEFSSRDHSATDLEAGLVTKKAGTLRIEYYRARRAGAAGAEPVQSHLKLTIIDNRIAIHGSGNMDRASWYTSQELGVAFVSTELVGLMEDNLSVAMDGRSETVYDSEG
ncbi:hypothetical protein LTR08_003561 [Meristemomyces frigidus]|nr:hypothetical protein LTR08_003561 [Meristemomyces frigidus]